MTNATNRAASTGEPWEPLWETGMWQDETIRLKHPPFSQWVWAFSWRQGIPVMLHARTSVERDSKGRVEKWVVDRAKASNPDQDLIIPWSVVEGAVRECRASKISLKEAIAKHIDPSDPTIPPQHFINFANAPDVFVKSPEEMNADPKQAEKAAIAQRFWDTVKAGKTAKPAAVAAKA